MANGQPVPGVEFLSGADVPEDYGRWLIHGPQGAGKTSLAGTIAECGPTLFIDLVGEKGIRSLRGTPFWHNLTFARPKSITDFDDIFWYLNTGNHPFVAVVVDSMTAVQKMTTRFMLGHSETAVREIRQGTAPADQRTWGQSLDIMVDTATFWFGLSDGNRAKPMHVVMTAQTKTTDGEDGATLTRTPDVQRGALSISLAAPDYILYCDVEENLDHLADASLSPVNHIVRFGSHPGYRTKGRLPYELRGKIPPILGRKHPTNLTTLSRVLRIGGIPAAKRKAAPAAPAATAAPVPATAGANSEKE